MVDTACWPKSDSLLVKDPARTKRTRQPLSAVATGGHGPACAGGVVGEFDELLRKENND